MKCPACHALQRPDALICEHCGEALSQKSSSKQTIMGFPAILPDQPGEGEESGEASKGNQTLFGLPAVDSPQPNVDEQGADPPFAPESTSGASLTSSFGATPAASPEPEDPAHYARLLGLGEESSDLTTSSTEVANASLIHGLVEQTSSAVEDEEPADQDAHKAENTLMGLRLDFYQDAQEDTPKNQRPDSQQPQKSPADRPVEDHEPTKTQTLSVHALAGLSVLDEQERRQRLLQKLRSGMARESKASEKTAPSAEESSPKKPRFAIPSPGAEATPGPAERERVGLDAAQERADEPPEGRVEDKDERAREQIEDISEPSQTNFPVGDPAEISDAEEVPLLEEPPAWQTEDPAEDQAEESPEAERAATKMSADDEASAGSEPIDYSTFVEPEEPEKPEDLPPPQRSAPAPGAPSAESVADEEPDRSAAAADEPSAERESGGRLRLVSAALALLGLLITILGGVFLLADAPAGIALPDVVAGMMLAGGCVLFICALFFPFVLKWVS